MRKCPDVPTNISDQEYHTPNNQVLRCGKVYNLTPLSSVSSCKLSSAIVGLKYPLSPILHENIPTEFSLGSPT